MSQCVCCGHYIPEGSHICKHCAAGGTPTEFMGLPIKEVIDLVTIYKSSPPSVFMTSDYVQGYKDGYKRCRKEFDEAFKRMTIDKQKEDDLWVTKLQIGRRK